MSRFAVFAWSVFAMVETGCAAESTVTRSDRGGNHAEIIQSGPEEGKPSVEIKEGPGYVIIEQRSKNNRAVIIQGGPQK